MIGVNDSNNKIITDGLILHYDIGQLRSYPTSGTNLVDLSSGSNIGMLVNGVGYNSNNGGSLVFNGLNNYIETNPIQPKYYTISVWFKALGPPSNNDSAGGALVCNNPQLSNGEVQFNLVYSWLEQKITFVCQGNNSGVLLTPNNSVLRNKWNQVVAVYSGTKQYIYINGVLITSVLYSNDPFYPTTGNINLQIGRWGYNQYSRIFNGSISEVMIYDRALTALEVDNNFKINKVRYINYE